MKATDDVSTSIFSSQLRTLFKLSTGKIPSAFWGLAGCLSKDRRQCIDRWHADGNQSSDLFKLPDATLKQMATRVTGLAAKLTANSATITLADAVEALAISHILAATGQLGEQANQSAMGLCEQELKKLATAALHCDSICELQTKSIGLEIDLVLACAKSDVRVVLNTDLLETFESIISSNLDADGWPDSRLLHQVGALAGCWSRIAALFQLLGLELDGNVQIQLEWLARQCLRLMQADGSLCFATASERGIVDSAGDQAQSFDEVYWRSVMSLSADPDDAVICQMLLSNLGTKNDDSKQGKTSKLTPAMANELVEPYNVSEWAGSFLLRGTWSSKSPRVAVDFSGRNLEMADDASAVEQCFVQISRTGSLVHGQTLPEIIVNDQAVSLAGSFEVTCERHDEDVDYIEIQADLSEGGVLSRQWLLSRTEEFLLVADCVLPTPASKIEYRCRWPLAPGMTTMEESETREVYLQTAGDKQKIKALVLPLALPEWKLTKFPGRLIAESDAIVLEQQTVGDALYAPLVFDLNPRRSLKKRTWRKLTVAQERQVVADDLAMAFRFQLNKRQWFFYRALASLGNRTFLGENVNSEFAFNRLHKSGKVSSLFEVE